MFHPPGLHFTRTEHGNGIVRICHHHHPVLSLLRYQVQGCNRGRNNFQETLGESKTIHQKRKFQSIHTFKLKS